MIDAHCHLQLLLKKAPLELVLSRARSSGISAIVTCACSVSDWTTPIDSLFDFPKISQQYGIHPWWVREDRPGDWLAQLRQILITHPESGVGEIGLDKNKKSLIPLDLQIDTFLSQFRLARELERTVTIHCVNAYGLLVDLLREEHKTAGWPPFVVIHSYSGSGEVIDQLKKISPSRIFFSVSAQCPRDSVIPFVPIENLLIETDSPDQPFLTDDMTSPAPPQISPKINDPSQLWHVATRVAKAISKDVDFVVDVTTRNAKQVFRIT